MNGTTLVIGVDAGSFRTLDPMLERGELPNLADVIDRGFRSTVTSSVPPWTPTAWTSLTTGKNPGKHGVFDFKIPDGSRLVNATDVRTHRLWDYFDRLDRPYVVVNVPVTYPVHGEGIVVPGYLSPKSADLDGQARERVDELRDELGDYRIYCTGDHDSDDELCAEYERLMEMRKNAALYLCAEHPWEFAMVQFQRTDTVFHELPEDEYVSRVYRKLDGCIGELRAELDPDNLFIVSDHGMGETGRWDFRINSWLRERGRLETTPDGQQIGWEKPGSETTGENGLVDRVFGGLADVGLTVRRFERVLVSLGIDRLIKRVAPERWINRIADAGGESIDRERSTTYCPSGPGLGLYCTEPDLVDTVIEELTALRDPDGELVFEWVRRAEEVYEGECLAEGPDVLVLPRGMQYYVSGTIASRVFDETNYRYNHMYDGIAIGAGDRIEPTEEGPQYDITDVAPTVAAIHDVPLDSSFDGEVMSEIVALDSEPVEREYGAVEYGKDGERDASVESRLEDLGYL